MSIEQIRNREQLPTLEHYPHPELEQDLARYNLLAPDQSTIFMVYDREGNFTHVHKFSSRRTPEGVEITYLDNENFLNKGLGLEEHEDYAMETTLLYTPEIGFSVKDISPAIRDFLDVTRENQIIDLEETREMLEQHGTRANYNALAYEVQVLLDREESLSEILNYIDAQIERISKGEFDDEELIIQRTWHELRRSEEDADFKSAEVISGDKKTVAKQLYAWSRERRASLLDED